MRTKVLVGMILIIMLSSSCNQIALKVAGISNPKIENKASIMKFLKKCKVDTNNLYCLDSTLFFKMRRMSFKPGWKEGFRPIQIRVYDKNGAPVMQWASCEGFLKKLKLFEEVPPKNVNELSEDLDLQSDLSQYYTLGGNPAKLVAVPGYDYYIIVYFGVWISKSSKESFRVVYQYIKDHPELNILVYKIDVDCQEFWGVECKTNFDIH
jgi:hypothetical protein